MIIEFSDDFDAEAWYAERMEKGIGYDDDYGFSEDWD